jgi:hypothetical protein
MTIEAPDTPPSRLPEARDQPIGELRPWHPSRPDPASPPSRSFNPISCAEADTRGHLAHEMHLNVMPSGGASPSPRTATSDPGAHPNHQDIVNRTSNGCPYQLRSAVAAG